MRVLVVAFLTAISTIAYSEIAPLANNAEAEIKSSVEPEASTVWPFGKKRKKKVKTSSRMKKNNRKMAKKFRRQNDDTLRR
jgi:hypothetical protein